MNAVDTNVLFYALDPRDPRKKAIADSLMLAFAQTLPPGIYIAMNGRSDRWDRVRKNRQTGIFRKAVAQAPNVGQTIVLCRLPWWARLQATLDKPLMGHVVFCGADPLVRA